MPIFDQNHPKTSNNQHDWTPHKIHHNRTQKQLRYFFLIYCKNITNFLFWVLWAYLAEMLTCRNFDVYLHAKMNSIPNFFLRYCKDIANLLLLVLWECLVMLINNNSPRCWNQLVGNFDVYLHARKTTSSLNSFLRYCKDIVSLLCWKNLGMFDHPLLNHSINL